MAGESAKEFLEANATLSPNGTYKLTQKQYMDFLAKHGVKKEMMSQIAAANRELFNGIYAFANEKLGEAVDKEIAAGNDASKQKVELSVTIPNGALSFSMEALKSYPVPKSDARVSKTNVVKFVANPQRALDKDLVAKSEEEMKKKLGL